MAGARPRKKEQRFIFYSYKIKNSRRPCFDKPLYAVFCFSCFFPLSDPLPPLCSKNKSTLQYKTMIAQKLRRTRQAWWSNIRSKRKHYSLGRVQRRRQTSSLHARKKTKKNAKIMYVWHVSGRNKKEKWSLASGWLRIALFLFVVK